MKKEHGKDSQTPRRAKQQGVAGTANRSAQSDPEMNGPDQHVSGGRLSRLATRVRGLFSRGSKSDVAAPIGTATEGQSAKQTPASRVIRRGSDIPMDRLDNAYVPMQTSLKGGFRDDGSDRQRDQEFAGGFAGDRFNDEDHLTNRSGDPRIGTHGRTYEPGESRDESRSNR